MTISKPAGMRFSSALSTTLMTYPPSGPITIAPMNIGISAPTMTPMVPIPPITAPRFPPIKWPPVEPIISGNK